MPLVLECASRGDLLLMMLSYQTVVMEHAPTFLGVIGHCV